MRRHYALRPFRQSTATQREDQKVPLVPEDGLRRNSLYAQREQPDRLLDARGVHGPRTAPRPRA